jgi:hypothetical protein
LAKGQLRQLKITTVDNFNLNLTGYDWLDEIYSRGAATLGGCGPIAIYCGFMSISCNANSHVLVGSIHAGEQSDAMCVCTENGHNSACQEIGRFNCVNDDSHSLVPGIPSDYVSSWGDEFNFPAGAVTQSQSITLSAPRPMPFPEMVPSGFLPVTEADTLAPATLVLAQPVTITIHYSDDEVQGGQESTLTVLRFDENSASWIPQSGVISDTAANTLTFQTQRFGTYGFSALPSPTVPATTTIGLVVLAVSLVTVLGLLFFKQLKPTVQEHVP